MTSKEKTPIVLTNYSFEENDAMDAYHLEWQSIRQARVALDETEEDREEQGKPVVNLHGL